MGYISKKVAAYGQFVLVFLTYNFQIIVKISRYWYLL